MVLIGLGSNLGERYHYLGAALWKISAFLEDVIASPVYESVALMPPKYTGEPMPPFLNMVVRGNTKLSPAVLLSECKLIEQELGRQDRGFWSSREIDIDILAYDDVIIQHEDLKVPHEHMLNRDFVMVPLNDIAPEWLYPVTGDYYQKTPDEIIQMRGYTLNEGLSLTDLTFG